MTELEFSDADDEPGGAGVSVAPAEGDPGTYGEWIADVERPAPWDVDEAIGYGDDGEPPDDAGEPSAARGDGQSSNWIRVDSRWHPSGVDPNVSD
jgi:hypothetical protein